MAAAGAEHHSPKIQKRTLKGHRGPVLCLAHSSERLAYYHFNEAPGGRGNNADASSPDDRRRRHHRHHPSLLLSGSEDGTARLWDLRARRTALCMVIPRGGEDGDDSSEVTSVAFHPSIAEERPTSGNDDDVAEDATKRGGERGNAGGAFPLHHDCTVYASTSNKAYGYDLRQHSSPIIKTPHFDLTSSLGCSDEINQLSFSFPKRNDGSDKYWLSAADDSGEAHMAVCLLHRHGQQQPTNITATAKKQQKIFHHAELSTMAILSAAVFQPRTNNDTYLATGGTDCTVKLWDASKPRRPTSTVQIAPSASENTTQLCNPPYVHSLSWSPSGRLLAAGIGDGSCAVLRAEGRRLTEVGRLGFDEGGHGSAVAAVCFPSFGSSADVPSSSKVRKSGEAEDRLVISAGNDGNILFWDLGGNMVGSGPLNPVSYLGRCLSTKTTPDADNALKEDAKDAVTDEMYSLHISNPKTGKKSKNRKKGKGKVEYSAKKDNGDFPDDLIIPSPPKILFQIAHRHKPNWITCSRTSDAAMPSSLFVADTTNNISVYTLPI